MKTIAGQPLLFEPPPYTPEIYEIAKKAQVFNVATSVAATAWSNGFVHEDEVKYKVLHEMSKQLAANIVEYAVQESGRVTRSTNPNDGTVNYQLGMVVTSQWEFLELLYSAYCAGESKGRSRPIDPYFLEK